MLISKVCSRSRSRVFILGLKNGFSLLEAIVVLIISGIMIVLVVEGVKYVEEAKLQKIVEQMQTFKTAIISFHDKYSYLPGDFPEAKKYLGNDALNGDGDGKVRGELFNPGSEVSQAWHHLQLAGLINNLAKGNADILYPKCSLGGCFFIEYNKDIEANCLVIAGKDKQDDYTLLPVFTPAQALFIAKSLGGGDCPISEHIRVISLDDKSKGINSEKNLYDLSVHKKCCIIYYIIEH